MTYRANKIRAAVEQKFGKGWNAGLDPYPYDCEYFDDFRHGMPTVGEYVCGTFAPRPEFEQDRSKYE